MKKGYILAGLTVLIWATMATFVKVMLSEIPNLQVLSISGVFAFAFLLLANIVTGNIKKCKEYTIRQYIQMAGLGFIGLFLYSALYYYGLSQLSAQMACIINYLWPVMLVIFSVPILHEKVTLKKIIALVASFVGVVILTMGDKGEVTGNFPLGVISCIVAAACYGLFSVLNKKANMNQGITMMILWLTVGVCSFISGMFIEEWVPISGIQWLGLVWLGVVTDAVAYLMWAVALDSAADSAKIANIAYLTPFISIIISALVLKEKVMATSIIALVFIIGGILIQSVNPKKTNDAPTP